MATKLTTSSHTIAMTVPSFSPTKVALFRQCPERYLRRYHVGPRHREPMSRPLARGKAVHALMAAYASRRSSGWRPTVPDAAQALDQSGFPAEEGDAFDEDADEVQRLVGWGVEEFDRRYGEAAVLLTESFLAYTHGQAGRPMFRLEAKIDLVVLHTDGVLERVDYKTGRFEIDDTQNLICRIVSGSNAGRLAAGRRVAGADTIRTSVIFLTDQETVSRAIPRDELRESWRELQKTLAAMMNGLAKPEVGVMPWLPQPNGLCNYCPFNAMCSLNTISDGDAAMQEWMTASPSFAG